jgi:hypothetical protein
MYAFVVVNTNVLLLHVIISMTAWARLVRLRSSLTFYPVRRSILMKDGQGKQVETVSFLKLLFKRSIDSLACCHLVRLCMHYFT